MKNLNSNYGKKLFNQSKQNATDVLITTSKRVIQETAEQTGHLIGNKIADIITRGPLQRAPKDRFTKRWKINKNNKKIKHITRKRQKIIDDLW